MQLKLEQYVRERGLRQKDPIAQHMIGLPGVGKSAMLDAYEKLGFKVIRVDAQALQGINAVNYMGNYLNQAVFAAKTQPTILLFDEIDKLPEIELTAQGPVETTQPAIGILNQILTDGKATINGSPYDLSNVMVVTAMNFSPEEIASFSREVLAEPKSFYDFTESDFGKFDEWIRSSPGATAKLLSHLFRANTVSRLSPNTLVAEALTKSSFSKIIASNAKSVIERATTGVNAEKRLAVKIDKAALVEFLYPNVINPPLGQGKRYLAWMLSFPSLSTWALRPVQPATAR